MTPLRTTITTLVILTLTGCASVHYGDKESEAKLKQFQPIPGKTSLYVCREDAVFIGAGNRTTVYVDGEWIGTLKPGNFAHTILEPGSHSVFLKLNPGNASGVLPFNTRAGEVVFVWAGSVGGGFGGITVDFFNNRHDAEDCVKKAAYSVPTT